MSKVWVYTEPTSWDDLTPVTHRYTEDEIIAGYFDHWAGLMRKIGKADQITRENCIADWVTINWAMEEA